MRFIQFIGLACAGSIGAFVVASHAQSPLPPEVPQPPIASPDSAQTPSATPGPIDKVPLPPADASGLQWQNTWDEARAKMVAGQFDSAATDFDTLAAAARNPIDRALAQNNADLCREWSKKDLVFVKRADLGESSLAAKATDVRTTDELAVLYTTAVFYGLGTGGFVATLTQPKDLSGLILPALGLAGVSVGIVAGLDAGRPLHYGVPQSIVTGTYIGLEEGIVWALWNQARTASRDEWQASTVATVIWGSATVGAVSGGIIGASNGTTPGRASWVGSASLWTGVVAGLFGAGFSDSQKDSADDHALLAAAIGLNAGAIAGLVTAKTVSPSIARVRFLDLGGIAGALLFGGLYIAGSGNGQSGSASSFFLATGVGTAIGLGTAWFATKSMPEDRLEKRASNEAAFATVSARVIPVRGGTAVGLGGQF